MKVLSLWQPWATLMALGVKVVETRGWETGYRGQLLIHASKRVVGRRGDRWTIGDFEVERDAAGYLLRGPSLGWPYRLPLGAAVARTDLVDVLPIIGADDRIDEAWQPHIAPTRPSGSELWIWLGPSATENLSTGRPTWRHRDITAEAPYGNYSPGRFGWVTENPWPLTSPIPLRGRQGLFNLPDDARAEPRGCDVDGCHRIHVAKGLCGMHYQRAARDGDPGEAAPREAKRPRVYDPICAVDGCDRPTRARGWCKGHYSRWQQDGDVRADVPLRTYTPRPACQSCGEEPMAGGTWCLPCFQARSLPHTRGDLEDAARRREMADRKRRERAARRNALAGAA